MTTQLTHFYFRQSSVRIQVIDGEPWFCLKDVCEILSVDRTSRLLRDLDKKGLADCHTLTIGGKQRLSFINEPNLYRVIFRSNKPEARQFQDWVFNEVLPAIRKTGHYQHPVTTPRRTTEPLTRSDMKNLNHLVVMMTRQFSRTGSWRLGVWHALRRAAGVPSPELFTVDDLPALTDECRRIIQITSEAGEMIGRIEREAVRRIVRHREDCEMVLGELQRECNSQRLSNAGMRQLERYEQIALRKLEQRVIA
ncbi:phage antirepressor protein [Salmonella enterica]|nr:phage antirepressor protein [Salmonella enterica]